MSLLKGSDSDERSETRVKIVSAEDTKRRASRIFAKQIIESWKHDGKLVPVRRCAVSEVLYIINKV